MIFESLNQTIVTVVFNMNSVAKNPLRCHSGKPCLKIFSIKSDLNFVSSLSLLVCLLKIVTATSKLQMQCALYECQLWKSSTNLDATISHLSKGLIDTNQNGTQGKVQFSGLSHGVIGLVWLQILASKTTEIKVSDWHWPLELLEAFQDVNSKATLVCRLPKISQ